MQVSKPVLKILVAFVSVALYAGVVRADDSGSVYDARCALCHQGKGTGVPGQFPRLAGRVRAIAAAEAGRRYLLHVVLNGMAGKIEVDESAIVGVMPSFASLNDVELAAALNYLMGLESTEKTGHKPKAFTAGDIQQARSEGTLTPTAVRSERETVIGPNGEPLPAKSGH